MASYDQLLIPESYNNRAIINENRALAAAAKQSAAEAKKSEESAAASEAKAKESESNAKFSEEAAKASEGNAKNSEENARKSEEIAAKSERDAAAQSEASTAASDATAKRNAIATSLGYESYDKMAEAAQNKQTIIDGGHIRTSLIEADKLAVEMAKIDQVISKKIQSDNYQHNKSGFMLDRATGAAHFEGDTHIGGNTSISGILQSVDYIDNKQGYKLYPNQETMLADKKTANFIAYLQVKAIYAEEIRGKNSVIVSHNIQEFQLNNTQKILDFLKSIANGEYEHIKIGLWYQCLGSIETSNNCKPCKGEVAQHRSL